jgi:small nuclear ribonucleoprotein (snRNP)-like protein
MSFVIYNLYHSSLTICFYPLIKYLKYHPPFANITKTANIATRTTYYLIIMLIRDFYREIVGTLRGFDEFVNMVLDDATEIQDTADGRKIRVSKAKQMRSI